MPNELVRDDIVGKEFSSVDDVEAFFTLYANFIGFSIRKSNVRICQDGEVKLR